ncbi:Uncharacterized protein FKW44_023755 [Caligus rogercresseyi]|uniref:Uncharacterized protein n=1 Tax=Caligus rogercresseyi TaxID=217165 RepID=A0A7T8GPV4_CALRO|nr:Uncharacterized protein FKW44_023755 [Caligus rogercresseyi]
MKRSPKGATTPWTHLSGHFKSFRKPPPERLVLPPANALPMHGRGGIHGRSRRRVIINPEQRQVQGNDAQRQNQKFPGSPQANRPRISDSNDQNEIFRQTTRYLLFLREKVGAKFDRDFLSHFLP